MEAGIRRSIGQGFRVAGRGGPGIGFFAGCWILVGVCVVVAVISTRVPAELFRAPEPVTQPAVRQAPAPTAPSQTPPAEAPASPSQGTPTADGSTKTDLFKQLATEPKPATSITQPATPPAPSSAAQRAAERDRILGEWLSRAWPILLLCVLLSMAANIWLTGGQIGYLAKLLNTQQARVSDIWAAGARSFGALLAGTLLSLVVGGGLMAVVFLVAWIFSLLSALPNWLLLTLGLVIGAAILIGIVWISVRLAFWFIAIVVDQRGPIVGLRASFQSTRGRWWQLCGLMGLLVLMAFGVSILFSVLENVGRIVGGIGGAVLGLVFNLVGAVVSLYVGFAVTAALITFYQDTKSVSSSAPPTAP